jgi:hypothetical protein
MGDSMPMIRALIKHYDIKNNVFLGVISRSLLLLVEFEGYSAFHIMHEYNNEVDHWTKHVSSLGKVKLL